MVDGYNFQQLKAAILALSRATDREAARLEWKMVGISEADEPETCLCGHFPIVELCSIANRVTGNSTDVGNVCVKRFLGFRSDLIFASIKRIRKDVDKSIGAEAAVFFRERGVINDWEYQFQQGTLAKRNLSVKQLASRHTINRKVLAAVARRGLS